MINQIFVNLHVKNLNLSRDFYTNLGFKINEQFSDDTAVSMVISETIYIMLLTYEKFQQFTPKKISDATKTTEVLNALSVDSPEEVDRLANLAMASGGTESRTAEDHGFMYSRAFNDPDGHIWELFWMDMSKSQEEQDKKD